MVIPEAGYINSLTFNVDGSLLAAGVGQVSREPPRFAFQTAVPRTLLWLTNFSFSSPSSQEHRLGRWDTIKAGRNGARVYALDAEALLDRKDEVGDAAAVEEEDPASARMNSTNGHTART